MGYLMAFNMTVYAFSKSSNSTKLPSNGRGFDIILKDNSGVQNPSIQLGIGQTDNPSSYTYAQIPAFGRYYYINEWTYNKGVWTANLSVDVMTTYRSQIGASRQYILRSSNIFNGNILDTLYPTEAGVSSIYSNGEYTWTANLTLGTYVVGIINGDLDGVGAVSYYVFTNSQFNQLCQYLFGNIEYLGDTGIKEELLKIQFDPFEYIVSCMWFPFQAPISESVSSVPFGWWTLPITASRLSATPLHAETKAFEVPKHPQAENRGLYLNLNPYSLYEMEFKPWGVIPIDSTVVVNNVNVYALINVDCLSGRGTLAVSRTTSLNDTFVTQQAQIGVPIQLAQIGIDYLATASTVASGVASVVGSVLKGDIIGAITGGISAVESSVKAALPQMQTSGSNGSVSDFLFTPQLRGRFYPLASESNETRGRPVCQYLQISSIPGYILTADAHMEIPGTQEETTQIEGIMNSGFYYE